MQKSNKLAVLVMVLVTAAASGIVSPISLARTSSNGVSLNGTSFNGASLNGTNLNGLKAENGLKLDNGRRADSPRQATDKDKREAQVTDREAVLPTLGQRALGVRSPAE